MLAPAHAGNEEAAADRRRFAWAVTVIFMALTAPRLLAHELWRDEAWQWLVVLESRSLGELFDGMSRGGGSGYLFPLLCYLLRQVWTSPRAMQLAHLLVAGAAAFAFARWAPLGRRERALFVFGYFPFYEYAVISRSYALGALLLWLSCLAARRRGRPLAFGAALGLLCQTTVYGMILAAAVATGWLVDRWQRRHELPPLSRLALAGGLFFAGAGAIAGLVQLDQAPGTKVQPWRFVWHPVVAQQVSTSPWRAFVPLLPPEVTFWNRNLLDPWPLVHATAGLSILVLAIVLLRRSKVALAVFAVGAAGLLAFGYTFLPGSMRHVGHLWLLFAAALWLGGGTVVLGDRRSWRARVVLGLLVIQCAAAGLASWVDLRHPFSNGAATAELVRREGLDRYPLFGHREPPAATVALYLGRPLYSPSRKVFVTHPDWGPRQRELAEPEVRCAARELARNEGRDVVLVINRALPPWEELDSAGATSGAIQPSEDYHLYRLRLGRLPATAATAGCPGELLADGG